MKRFYLSLLVWFILGFSISNSSYASGAHLDFAAGSNAPLSTTAFSGYYLISLLDDLFGKDRVRIGGGLRLSSFQGNDVKYSTADAELVAEKNTNQIVFDSVQTNSLNFASYLNLKIIEDLGFGANLDLAGIGFGPGATGTYESDDASLDGTGQDATPTSTNLFQGGIPDIGQLNSEFYLYYKINDFIIRGGSSHFFSEYTTDNKLDDGNDRFRIITNLSFIAVSYSFDE